MEPLVQDLNLTAQEAETMSMKKFWMLMSTFATFILFGILVILVILLLLFYSEPKVEAKTFDGEWATVSQGVYFLLDPGGERYTEFHSNFAISISKEYQGYLARGFVNDVDCKTVPDYYLGANHTPSCRAGNPISFDARGYNWTGMDCPHSLEKNNTKLTVNCSYTSTQQIVLDYFKNDPNYGGKDTLYVTLSVIPTNYSRGGFVTDADNPIVLVRKAQIP